MVDPAGLKGKCPIGGCDASILGHMAQVTLYLDTATEARMRAAAKAAGVSISRWVATVIRERTATEWPRSVVELRGAWADFPKLEEIRRGIGRDAPRERL